MDFSVPYISRRRYSETEGVNDAWVISARAFGKDNRDNPYLIPNEWIAGSIAQFLGVPVPPFALMRKHDRRTVMFASVSFEGDTTPRDAVPSILWANHPHLCTGILVFDILMANCDRHSGNIKVDDPASPKRVYVFDHDRALFYVYAKKGAKRLKDMQDCLGIRGGAGHCLIDEANTAEHFGDWVKRVQEMPLSFIERVCSQVHRLGATRREVGQAVKFLNHRRQHLGELVYQNRAEFPSIPPTDWPLFL